MSEFPWTAADDERLLFALTGQKPEPFRLLALPDEIWVRIGKLAIDSSPAFTTTDLFPPWWRPHSDPLWAEDARPQPAITRTCRVLRHELLPYYYATKIDVVLHTYHPDPSLEIVSESRLMKAAGQWLSWMAPESRKCISGIRVRVPARRADVISAWLGGLGIAAEFKDEPDADSDDMPLGLLVHLGGTGARTYRARFLGSREKD